MPPNRSARCGASFLTPRPKFPAILACLRRLLPWILTLSKIAGAAGGRNAEGAPPGTGLNAVRLQLNAVINVVDSADRTPPAQAYALFDQASRDLATQLAAWNSLKTGKLVEINRSLQTKQLPQIELRENHWLI